MHLNIADLFFFVQEISFAVLSAFGWNREISIKVIAGIVFNFSATIAENIACPRNIRTAFQRQQHKTGQNAEIIFDLSAMIAENAPSRGTS